VQLERERTLPRSACRLAGVEERSPADLGRRIDDVAPDGEDLRKPFVLIAGPASRALTQAALVARDQGGDVGRTGL
jgi:hypothetical protein